MKRDCKIVQDLLPNYIEKLTNEETNKYIEEHLKECEECKKMHENMKKELEINTNQRDKREVKYIKKFSNKLRILKMILLVILIAFIGIIGYKVFVIKGLQGKMENYKDITNFHITKTSYGFQQVVIQEAFHKDDNYLVHVRTIGEDTPKREIISTKNGNNYLTADGNKVAILNSMPIHTPEKVYNYLETENFGEFVAGIFGSHISSVKCNDKECYKIENFRTSDLLFPEQGICVYIDKETGLIVRIEEGTRSNENGEFYTQVTDYKYEFNTVTDEDLKEPDVSEYIIEEQ